MKPFSKNEYIGIGIILLVTFSVTFINMRLALRRARDAQRKADLGTIGFFPPSGDAKIKACPADNFYQVIALLKEAEVPNYNLLFQGLRPCEWGKDSLTDLGLFGSSEKVYLKTLFADPQKNDGISYYYLSNSKRFQLYSNLEGGEDEDGYNYKIVGRNLNCGGRICSYGKSFAETPLDKSIEEYENELAEREKAGKK